MAHYVFLVGEYDPVPSANGNCVRMLVNELALRGNVVDVICYGNSYCYDYKRRKSGNVCTIKRDVLPGAKLKKWMRKIVCLPRARWWPVGNPQIVTQYVKMLIEINTVEKIDYVIACQIPFAASAAGTEFKKIVPTVGFFIYELDSFWNSVFLVTGLKKLFRKNCRKIETDFFDAADVILHLECNREAYERKEYEKYQDKIYYTDIPLISEEEYNRQTELTIDVEHNENCIKLIYSGSLYSVFRKPDYIVKLIEKVSEDYPCRLFFYSKGSCEDWLKTEADENECIRTMGFVSKDELDREIASSDFLVSIGNLFPEGHNAVPSKIFEYMSTGKPIIHELAGDSDICKKYFADYPNIMLLDPRESFECNLMKLKCFLLERKGVRVQFERIVRTLIKNTPQYSVDLIEKVLKDNKAVCK